MRTYIDDHGKEIVEMTIQERGPLTEEQKERLRNARNIPQEYDEDCPPMPEDMHRAIQSMITEKRKIARQLVRPVGK